MQDNEPPRTSDEDQASFQDLAPAEGERLRARLIRIRALVADLPMNHAAGVVGTLVMAFIGGQSARNSPNWFLPWIWGAFLSAEGLRTIWHSLRFNSEPRSEDETLGMARRLAWSGVIAGSAWGSFTWFMLPTSDPQLEETLLVGHALMMIAVVGTKSVYTRNALQLMVPMSIVSIAGLLRIGDEIHMLTAGAFMLVMLALLSFLKVQDKTLNAAIYLRFRTERLLSERSAEKLEADAARREAVEARQSADLANMAKTTFLTAAGHDLRQPMHALVLYFGQLKRANQDRLLDDTLDRIGKSMDAMQDLLDSIVEVSRLMTGLVTPTWSRCSIDRLFDRLEAQLKPLAEGKGLQLIVAASNLTAHSDESMLERILRNLILNAIRHGERGRIVVRARRRGGAVAIQVFDEGIGIARAELERIFEPFYQIANPQRDRQKGIGLGLAIVRNLGELLDIDVIVRSRPGKGSVFTLVIPPPPPMSSAANDGATPLAVAVEASGRDFVRGAFIVLIDDDDESLQATGSSLRTFGGRVLTARSGAEAIEALRRQDSIPQLIVSDHRLENGSGLDAIEDVGGHLRARFGEDIQFAAFVLSGETTPAEVASVLEAGYPMLHKPLSLEALYRAANDRLADLAAGTLAPAGLSRTGSRQGGVVDEGRIAVRPLSSVLSRK